MEDTIVPKGSRKSKADIADLAVELWRSIQQSGTDLTQDARETIDDMLVFAASAKRQLVRKDRRIRSLEEMALTDELTGLANRRAFQKSLTKVLAASKRHGEGGVIAYIDMDGFKTVNDSFGHQAGDMLLRHVSALLIDQVRETDLVARVGGDEFAMVLVRAEPEAGAARARDISDTLNASQVYFKGNPIPVQASVGIEVYEPNASVDELMARADARMYQSKMRRRGLAPQLRVVNRKTG